MIKTLNQLNYIFVEELFFEGGKNNHSVALFRIDNIIIIDSYCGKRKIELRLFDIGFFTELLINLTMKAYNKLFNCHRTDMKFEDIFMKNKICLNAKS